MRCFGDFRAESVWAEVESEVLSTTGDRCKAGAILLTCLYQPHISRKDMNGSLRYFCDSLSSLHVLPQLLSSFSPYDSNKLPVLSSTVSG